jgi:hypothetical protein
LDLVGVRALIAACGVPMMVVAYAGSTRYRLKWELGVTI